MKTNIAMEYKSAKNNKRIFLSSYCSELKEKRREKEKKNLPKN